MFRNSCNATIQFRQNLRFRRLGWQMTSGNSAQTEPNRTEPIQTIHILLMRTYVISKWAIVHSVEKMHLNYRTMDEWRCDVTVLATCLRPVYWFAHFIKINCIKNLYFNFTTLCCAKNFHHSCAHQRFSIGGHGLCLAENSLRIDICFIE